jgi:hypothetical protein
VHFPQTPDPDLFAFTDGKYLPYDGDLLRAFDL